MINDICFHLSSTQKNYIKPMEKNVTNMQKENRVRLALLMQKQSELSSRQNALSEKKLIRAKLKEENKRKKDIMNKCQAQVDNYRLQIDSIKKEILQTKINLKAITTQIFQTNLPDLVQLKESISKRKKNINENQVKFKDLKNEDKNLDSQKQKLVNLIDSKQKLLLKFTSREEKVSQTLQIPIDDLRLEEITVNKLEQFVSQINNEIDSNESNSDNSNYTEELIVKKIEEENQIKKNRINQIKERIKFLKSQPPTIKSKKVSSTPTKRLNKLNPISYDKDRLLRFNSTINSFKERQKMIDQLENTTTSVQIAWANDQKQIEDSWMGKMDDMQVLQKKVDEIENLIFDIDEYSERIHQLKEEESLLNEKKSECEKSKSKIELKIYEISECHNTMQKQVDDYVKKKEKVDKAAEILKIKKKNILILRNEIKQLDNYYQQYRLKVKAIENKANEIKNSLNVNLNQSQISEPLDHVKFSDYLIPKVDEISHYSKISVAPEISVTPKVNTSPKPKKKEEKLTTPIADKNRKDPILSDENLSDSTFSIGELERDDITNSIINNNNHIQCNNQKNNGGFNNSNHNSANKNYSNNIIQNGSPKKNISNNEVKDAVNSINKGSQSCLNASNKDNNYSSFNSNNSIRKSGSINKGKNDSINSNKSTKDKESSDNVQDCNGLCKENKISQNKRQRSHNNSNKKEDKNNQKSPSSIKSNLKSINKINNENSNLLSNSENNQDSQRSEIEIEFSDNENTKSVDQSIIKKHSLIKSEMIFSTNSKYSHNSKDSKLDSLKKIIKDEQEEEKILSKYTSFTAKEEKNISNDNQYSSDFVSFNRNKYEAILNCTDSSRSAMFINNNSIDNNNTMKSNLANDSTFRSTELENDVIEEEEEDIPENDNKIIIQEEEEQEVEYDVFDNISTSYQVESNPVFPAPELFSDKNSNLYEYSKEMSEEDVNSVSAVAITDVDKDFQTTEFKNFYSESTHSQITPTKKVVHPSKIDIDVGVIETPNPNRYKRNRQFARINNDDESDEEFNNLIKEAQNAIELPLLKSKYQSP